MINLHFVVIVSCEEPIWQNDELDPPTFEGLSCPVRLSIYMFLKFALGVGRMKEGRHVGPKMRVQGELKKQEPL